MSRKNTTRLNRVLPYLESFFTIKKTRIAAITVVSLIFFLFLWSAHTVRPYGSDDVAIQNVVDSYMHGDEVRAVVGTDNFAIKIPLYFVVNLILDNSRVQLFITVLLCNAILLFGVLFVIRHMQERYNWNTKKEIVISYLPAAVLLGLTALALTPSGGIVSSDLTTAYLNPNYRNAEAGIMLIFFVFLDKYINRGKSLKPREVFGISLVASLLLGFFFYSDPYFVYVLGGATILFTLLQWLRRRLPSLTAIVCGCVILLAILTSHLIGAIFVRQGFIAADNIPRQFTSISGLATNQMNLISGLFTNFDSNFWDKSIDAPFTALLLLNSAVLFIFLISFCAYVYRLLKSNSLHNFESLLTISGILIVLAYLLTKSGNDINNYRYLSIFGLICIPMVSYYVVGMSRMKNIRPYMVLVIILSLCIFFNSSANAAVTYKALTGSIAVQNNINEKLIADVTSKGAHKGYAGYWDANITTYLSNRQIRVLPLLCVSGKFIKYSWLVNSNDFSKPSNTSFLISNDSLNSADNWAGCDLSELGTPVDIHKIGEKYVYYFNYDLGKPLGTFEPKK